MLGILPNSGASIKKVKKAEEAWIDISKSLFWQGFELWSKRKDKMKEFWKSIAPEECGKHIRNEKTRRRMVKVKRKKIKEAREKEKTNMKHSNVLTFSFFTEM